MNRIVTSFFAGLVITLSIPLVVDWIQNPGSLSVGYALVYWPLPLMDNVGLGTSCAGEENVFFNGDCIRNLIFVLLSYYSLMPIFSSCLVYIAVFKRQDKKRSASIASLKLP